MSSGDTKLDTRYRFTPRMSPAKTESEYAFPTKNADLLSVKNRVVFVRRGHETSGLFYATLNVENLSPRYVAFLMRSSDPQNFRITPRYGCIPPRKVLKVQIATKNAGEFKDLLQHHFGVFAVPIYDKRLLVRQKLQVLWQAYETDLFPYESSEFHSIRYVLPKCDSYFEGSSILDRVSYLPIPKRKLISEDNGVDEETFYLNWPKGDHNMPTMDEAMSDWNMWARQIHVQTNSIVDKSKAALIVVGVFVISCTYQAFSFITGLLPLSRSPYFTYERENPIANANKQEGTSSCPIS